MATDHVVRPLRVFHLIRNLEAGGAETLLVEALRHADREQFIYGYGYLIEGEARLADRLIAQGATPTCFGARSNWTVPAKVFRIAAHLREWKADVLHCHLPAIGVLGRLAGRLAGVPVVYTEHNVWERYHPLVRWLNRLTWGWQNHVIAVSEEVRKSIVAGVRGRVPVTTVLNGVDVERFTPDRQRGIDLRRELGILPDAPVVVNVASLKQQKGIDRWLDAAALILAEEPRARFLVVGDGPDRKALEIRTAQLGLGAAVLFAGARADVRPFLAAADVYMMSSEFEGLPLALLEAMAAERAVVSTAVGGIPEVIVDQVNGMLAPMTSECLAAAAVALIRAPDRRRELGLQARRTMEERFSMRRMSSQLEGVYRLAVPRSPTSGVAP